MIVSSLHPSFENRPFGRQMGGPFQVKYVSKVFEKRLKMLFLLEQFLQKNSAKVSFKIGGRCAVYLLEMLFGVGPGAFDLVGVGNNHLPCLIVDVALSEGSLVADAEVAVTSAVQPRVGCPAVCKYS